MPCEQKWNCKESPCPHSVRFAAETEIHYIETRSELQPFDLWNSPEEQRVFRQSAKDLALRLREENASVVEELEEMYQLARETAKDQQRRKCETTSTFDGISAIASGARRLESWSNTVNGRGLERYSISKEVRERHSDENVASRNMVINVQHLLRNKANPAEAIAKYYASFSLPSRLLAQMMALADAQTAAATTLDQTALFATKLHRKEHRSSLIKASAATANHVYRAPLGVVTRTR